jgi:hypothetical protein
MLAEAMGDDFESSAFKLVGKESLGRLMQNGTKILAEIGAQTMVAIIQNVCSVKII